MYNTSDLNEIKGMVIRDPDNRMFYTWYNLSWAKFNASGTLTMRCSGINWLNKAEGTTRHWVGIRSIKPTDPDYAMFSEAVKKAQTETW